MFSIEETQRPESIVFDGLPDNDIIVLFRYSPFDQLESYKLYIGQPLFFRKLEHVDSVTLDIHTSFRWLDVWTREGRLSIALDGPVEGKPDLWIVEDGIQYELERGQSGDEVPGDTLDESEISIFEQDASECGVE